MARAALVLIAVAALCGAARGRSAPIIGLSGDDTRHGTAVVDGEYSASHELEVTRYHLDTLVQTRFARSVLTIEVRNNAQEKNTATIPFAIPENSMLVNFEIESDGKIHQARPVLRDAIQVDSTSSLSSITARNAESFDVKLELNPASSVVLRLEYEELLVRHLQRYTNVQQVWPGGVVADLKLTVRIKEATPINSDFDFKFSTDAATSAVNSLISAQQPSAGEVLITLQPNLTQQREIAAQLNLSPESGLAGQFVVSYDVQRYPTAGDIVVHDGYFAHFLAPSDLKALPKYALFLLDVSGSMSGRKIGQLGDAMSTILGQLGPDDVFTVIEFSSLSKMWDLGVPSVGRTCNVYSTQYVAQAQQKARFMNTNGRMTAMLDGLQQAVRCAALGPAGFEPILLMLTDDVPNEPLDQIQAAISRANRPSKKSHDIITSIFTLAFGDDANLLEFLRELALRNGGTSKQIYVASDASLQLQDFYKSIATPLLKDVSVVFDDQQAEQGSITQKDFRTYFMGSELIVAGRLPPGQGDKLSGTVTAIGRGGATVNYPIQVSTMPSWKPEMIGGQANSQRLWAFLQTSQLLDKEVVDGQGSAAGIAATDMALQYSFVTPHTCLALDIINPSSVWFSSPHLSAAAS